MYYSSVYKIFWGPKGGFERTPSNPPCLRACKTRKWMRSPECERAATSEMFLSSNNYVGWMVSCVLVKLSESTLLFSSSGELSIGRTHIIQINELTRITTAISWPSLFSGLDYWTGLLDWTTGLTETTTGGERNKTIPRFDTAMQERRGYLASLPACSAQYSVRSWCKCAFLFKIGVVILGTGLS